MPPVPKKLQAQQRHFKNLVCGPELPAAADCSWLNQSVEFAIAERLEVYRYAYWARLVESLQDDFPRTRRLVGEAHFDRLCRRYLTQYPSRFASVAEVSHGFAEFLRNQDDLAQNELLSELARFEWAEMLVSLEELPESNLDQMGLLGEEAWERVVFVLNPSLFLFESRVSVHRTSKLSIKKTGSFRTVLFRAGGRLRQQKLSTRAFALFEKLREGATLGELQTYCSGLGMSEQLLSEWFHSWSSEGLIYGFRQAQPK